MDSFESALSKFFGVAVRGRTYLNALYLLLAFPLGLFYFIFLVVGLSLGVSLLIVWVGLFVLLAVFAGWYGLAAFERQMAIGLLGEDIPPMQRRDLSGKSLWQMFTATLSNSVTWKGLVYLFAKFPLGIFSFVAFVTLASISGALLTAPLYYQFVHPQINLAWNYSWAYTPIWVIDTLPEALAAFFIGVLLTVASMHLLNGLAWVSGKFARAMLGNFSSAPAAPSAPEAPAAPPEAPSAPPAPENGAALPG